MQGNIVMTAIKQQLDVIMSAQQKPPEASCVEDLFTKLRGSFDDVRGGFGGAPRFPQPSKLGRKYYISPASCGCMSCCFHVCTQGLIRHEMFFVCVLAVLRLYGFI